MVAVEARMRHHGVSKEEAVKGEVGTALGRLWLAGEISTAQRDAGRKYLELYEAYLRALKAPVGLRVTNLSGDGGDIITEAYEEWATKVVAEYEVKRDALAQIVPPCEATIRYVVLLDNEAWDYMLPGLRAGLSVLAEKFGIGEIPG